MSLIIRVPDPQLQTKSLPIDPMSDEAANIARDLQETLFTKDWRGHVFGLGLAAVQIGKHIRVLVVKKRYGTYKVLINPEILAQKWNAPWPERCFSVEGRYMKRRWMKIRVRYQTLDGTWKEEKLLGPRAAIIQHEMDHLEGKLISDEV